MCGAFRIGVMVWFLITQCLQGGMELALCAWFLTGARIFVLIRYCAQKLHTSLKAINIFEWAPVCWNISYVRSHVLCWWHGLLLGATWIFIVSSIHNGVLSESKLCNVVRFWNALGVIHCVCLLCIRTWRKNKRPFWASFLPWRRMEWTLLRLHQLI